MKRLIWGCLLPLVAMAIGAAGPAHAASELKIGVLVSLTGTSAADGTRLLNAHQLAAKQINDAGGIAGLGGAKINLVVADTQSKPEVARSETERLISREKVSVVLGAWASATTIPSVQVAERYRVPFVVTSAVTDAITEQSMQFVFRVSPKGSWAAKDVGAFIGDLRQHGVALDKVAIAYEDGPFGQTVSAGYRKELAAQSIKLVADESFRTGSADVSTQVAKIKASGADLVLIVAYIDDESVLVRSMAAQQYRPYILGYGGGHTHPTLLELGDLVEGAFGVVEWMPDLKNPAAKAFADAYKAAYGALPLSNSAQAFAATWVSALGADAAHSADPVAIRDALRQLKLKDGPATLLPNDALAFDESGQNHVSNVMSQVIDGKFVTVWPTNFAAQPFKPRK